MTPCEDCDELRSRWEGALDECDRLLREREEILRDRNQLCLERDAAREQLSREVDRRRNDLKTQAAQYDRAWIEAAADVDDERQGR